MTDASGTTVYSYDVRDRLLSRQTPFGTLTYTYDDTGDLLTVRSSNTNGVSVDYTYDSLRRLSTVKDNSFAGVTSYSYDPVGNLQSYQYPNGVTTTHVYNSLNRLTSINSSTAASLLASYSYTLGSSGNRTSVTEASGRTVTYAYDDLYRLTGESISNDTHGNNGAITYGYDAVGNRLSRNSTIASIPSQTSTFDANDRLTSDTYDANGNTTSTSGSTFSYDFENRLISENGNSVLYQYDGDGNRVAKTVGGATTHFLVDTNNPTGLPQVIEEIQGGLVTRTFTYGHSRINQRIVGGAISFYQYDGRGSVRQLTDATATVTDAYDYDSFGNLIYRTGTTPNDYLFNGEQFDANLGFYYLRARYLNPQFGRFVSMDSFEGVMSDPMSLHKYLYANADPINRSDPTGFYAGVLDLAVSSPVNLTTISMRILQVILAAGVGVEIARYFDRRWRMWTAVRLPPREHACMLAKDSQRGLDWSYDVGWLSREEYGESKESPFSVFEGRLVKRRYDGDMTPILPVGRMMDWQLQLFEIIMMGGTAGADEPYETPFAYAFAYRNCFTWTAGATATARIVSMIPS